MLPSETCLLCKIELIEYMISWPNQLMGSGLIRTCFDVDFLTNYPCLDVMA